MNEISEDQILAIKKQESRSLTPAFALLRYNKRIAIWLFDKIVSSCIKLYDYTVRPF